MAVNNPTTLSFPPVNYQLVDTKTGIMTPQWAQWFQQAYVRMGGTTPIPAAIPSRLLADDSPFDQFVNVYGHNVTLNMVMFKPGQIIYLYISALGVTTQIDSFTAQNNSATPGTVVIYSAPVNTLPNQSIAVVPVPAHSGVISIPQATGFQLGSAAYFAVVCTPSQQIRCRIMGRTIS